MPVGRVGFRNLVSQLGFGLKSVVGVATLAALLSACQGPGYLQYGIGSELPAADIARATALQNQYFKYLCQQAGFPDGCALPLYDRGTWTLIVLQGMNDIDRRCDAYLQWLDDRKRSRGPLLSQINDLSTATTSIMTLIDPNSAAALQIVAIAFNLLSNSIENYNSRLLDEIESSTVNSVVLRARHDFRADISDKAFSSRPEAEYALREYLKRCLPFAIETQINDLSTLGSRGIPTDAANTIFQGPVLGRQLLRDLPASAEGEVRRTRPITSENGGRSGGVPTPPDTRARTDLERQYSNAGVSAIQRKLCVPESGVFDATTRAALGTFEEALELPPAKGMIDTGKERDILQAEPDGCSGLPSGAVNTFEKFYFRGDNSFTSEQKVEQFQTAIYICIGDIELARSKPFAKKPSEEKRVTGTLNEDTRNAIIFSAPELEVKSDDEPAVPGTLSSNLTKAIMACTIKP